jgi:hypothetical protein
MIEELVSRCFTISHSAHLAHWKTDSYSQHVTLGEFYDEVIDQIDGIVEAYQGWYGLIGKVDMGNVTPEDIVEQISGNAMWITENRDAICKNNPMLENLIDGLTDLFSTTFYKLKQLK